MAKTRATSHGPCLSAQSSDGQEAMRWEPEEVPIDLRQKLLGCNLLLEVYQTVVCTAGLYWCFVFLMRL